MNIIRREEAHNREISSTHLKDLERLYEQLLSEISISYPALTLAFLVENWRIQLQKIMYVSIKPTYTPEEFNALPNIEDKRQLIIKDCTNQIEYFEGIIIKLSSLKPPVSKKLKHEALITQLEDYLKLQIKKLDATANYNFENVQKLLDDLDEQRKRMDSFSKQFLIEES